MSVNIKKFAGLRIFLLAEQRGMHVGGPIAEQGDEIISKDEFGKLLGV